MFVSSNSTCTDWWMVRRLEINLPHPSVDMCIYHTSTVCSHVVSVTSTPSSPRLKSRMVTVCSHVMSVTPNPSSPRLTSRIYGKETNLSHLPTYCLQLCHVSCHRSVLSNSVNIIPYLLTKKSIIVLLIYPVPGTNNSLTRHICTGT